jgi:hypothetical protein
MQRKWKIGIAIWFGFLLYFGIGSHYKKGADLFLVVPYLVLLLAASLYNVVIWLRNLAKGEPEKTYHLSAYPRSVLRFVLDDPDYGKERRKVHDGEGRNG